MVLVPIVYKVDKDRGVEGVAVQEASNHRSDNEMVAACSDNTVEARCSVVSPRDEFSQCTHKAFCYFSIDTARLSNRYHVIILILQPAF